MNGWMIYRLRETCIKAYYRQNGKSIKLCKTSSQSQFQ
uniref:Uncharacterized protein n=1 Tax=Anguilla anguilla TaxID=7936 RepID=A0A0E9QMF9_ANGAN